MLYCCLYGLPWCLTKSLAYSVTGAANVVGYRLPGGGSVPAQKCEGWLFEPFRPIDITIEQPLPFIDVFDWLM